MLSSSVSLEVFVAGLKTKSDKIRSLARAGVATADIARFLGIRYQHARNVIMAAGIKQEPQPEGLAEAAANDPGGDFAWVRLDANGGLTVPAELLAAVGLKPGDSVHLRRTADGLEFFSRQAALARIHQITVPFKRPGVSEVDEFLAERRRETVAEEARHMP